MVSKNTYLWVIGALVLCFLIQALHPDDAHSHYPFHTWSWFDALYGFVGCIAIVFISKLIGKAYLWRTTYSLPLLERDVGSGIETVKVIRWCVKDGDKVDEGQILLEVETERGAVIPIKSPAPGTIARTFYDTGVTAVIDETLVDLEVSDFWMKKINEQLEAAHV